MLKIVVTNEKGGTGKSTLACLLVDYLNWKHKKVQLIDTDEIQTAQTWATNCQEEGRTVSQNPAEYQVIDTPGSGGSALRWLKAADLIVVPFRAHYADLQTTILWFTSLTAEWQKKISLVPNQWQKTKEQQEGLQQLQAIVQEEQHGQITAPLRHRPALYGAFLNGNKENFFANPKLPPEIKSVISEILNHASA